MSVDQAAAEAALSPPQPRRGDTRLIGAIAVGLALLSAFVTFIVLADLTPIDTRHYFILGKAYGSTNIIALNKAGNMIANTHVTVLNSQMATVTLQRGTQRTTYNCTSAHCEAAPQPGDGKEVFDTATTQITAHQGALFLGGRRGRPGPQRFEFGEVGVHRRGVQHEQPGGLRAVVAEGVRRAARHQQEVVPPAALLHAVKHERDRPVEHPEGFGAVHVPVRQRAAAARRNGPLHQGEVTARLRGDGLEGHHASPRRHDLAQPRGNDA